MYLHQDAFSVQFSRRTSWSDPWNIRVHADVAKVSQKCINGASKWRDRRRDLLFAIEFGCAEKVS